MAKQKILIIDDEVDLLEMLKMRLESQDYEVLYLNSGEDAIKTIQEEKPDLIMLDIMLPDKNGCDICFELKRNEDTASIPVIIFTAKPDWKEVMDTLGKFVKADGYMSKPFESQELMDKIKKLLKE